MILQSSDELHLSSKRQLEDSNRMDDNFDITYNEHDDDHVHEFDSTSLTFEEAWAKIMSSGLSGGAGGGIVKVGKHSRHHRYDPQGERVTTVAAALNEVAATGTTAPSPSKIYANAVTTLEMTLGDEDYDFDDENNNDRRDLASLQDTIYTQSALLRILAVVFGYVNPATLAATINLTSRVLRGVVAQAEGLLTSDAVMSAATVSSSSVVLLDTADGLGCLSVLLCDVCTCTTQYVQQVQTSSPSPSPQIQQLVQGVFLKTWHDASRRHQQQQSQTRSIVQMTAQSSLCALVLNKGGVGNDAVCKVLTQYIHHRIDRYVKNSKRQEENQSFVALLGLLSTVMIGLDFDDIGGKLMTIVVDLLRDGPELASSSSAYIVSSLKANSTSLHIVTINAILSTVLSLLESDYHNENEMKSLEPFAARVLASLVQVQPTLTYRKGAAELDLLESGRTIYGQVMLSACQRVLTVSPSSVISSTNNLQVGTKLLPLAIKHLLILARPIETDDVDSDTAITLAEELTQLFRVQLLALKTVNKDVHSKCAVECLRVLESSALTTPLETSNSPFLSPIGSLLKQMEPEDPSVAGCVETLINLRCDETSVNDESIRRLIDAALGLIIEGMGVEQFWKSADISTLCSPVELQTLTATSSTGAANHQSWIVDVMKEAGSMVTDHPMHLSFFREIVLPLARKFDVMYAKHSTPSYRTAVVHLWSLFPVFCRAPADTGTIFPNLAPILVKAMNDRRYPELAIVVNKGLTVLATGVSERVKDLEELIEGDEGDCTRKEAEVVGQVATKLLPSLFKLVDSLYGDPTKSSEPTNDEDIAIATTPVKTEVERDTATVTAVSDCIAALARTAPKVQVQGLFTKVVQRMLQTSQSQDEHMVQKMCSLLSLSQSLVVSECLDESSISLLFRSLKPIIRTDETAPRIQKRAYKVLAEICKRYHSFISDQSRIKEVMDLLTSTTVTSQVSARVMRLKCLAFVVEGYGNAPVEIRKKITTSLVGETLLCLKDSNAKTRDGAYKLLLEMAKVHDDHSDFIKVVGAALGSKTPHMRSAAVTALSRLVFEFCSEDLQVQQLLPSMIKTVMLLTDDPAREVTKSMVAFARVSVSAATSEQLEPLLPEILGGLLKYHRGKDRFRAKIKIIIKKLVKMFGYDVLMPHVPPSDARLLTHMRKLSEREARRKKTRRGEHKRSTRDDFDVLMDSDEEDSDDGRTLMTGMTGAMTRVSRMSRVTSKSGQHTLKRDRGEMEPSVALSAKSARSRKSAVSFRIKNDTSGEVLDVKDLTQKTVSFADDNNDDTSDDGADLEFDASGKLVVPDIDDSFSTENNKDVDVEMSSFSNLARLKRSPGGRGDQSVKSQKSKQKKTNAAAPGSAYKAKKAGGDVKKKGQKYEPYAYVQLDGKQYTRKNRRQAVEQMGSVVHRANKRQKR